MRKKLFNILLIVALLTCLWPLAAAAADEPTISCGRASQKPGGFTKVQVTMEGNPGVSALWLSVSYDGDHLKLADTDWAANGEVFSDAALTPGPSEQNPGRLLWAQQTDTHTSGLLVTLTFEVRDGAAAGTYPIRVTCLSSNNAIEEPVEWTMAQGSFTVLPLSDEEKTSIELSDTRGANGQYAEVKLDLKNNHGVAALTANIEYDQEALTLVESHGTGLLTGGELALGEVGTYPYSIAWASTSEVKGDGTFVVLRFQIASEAEKKDYTITVSGNAYRLSEDAIPMTLKNGTITVRDAATIDISGTVIFQGNYSKAMVTLLDKISGEIVASVQTDVNGAYTFIEILEGEGYTLLVEKPGYLTYTIKNLTLIEGEEIEEVDIRTIAGDVDGNGTINIFDTNYLLRDFGGPPINYPNADIDGNGQVNIFDLNYLLSGFGKNNIVVDK